MAAFAVLPVFCGCLPDGDPPELRLSSSAYWLPADGQSTTRIEIRSATDAPPLVAPSLGRVLGLSRVAPGVFQATLQSGTTTGRVTFGAAWGEVVEDRPIYFIPPPDPAAPPACDRDDLTSYTITIDRASETVVVDFSDVDNALGGGGDVYLLPSSPPVFSGDTVEMIVVTEGTGLARDLFGLVLTVDEVAGGARLGEGDTAGGAGYFLGDFPATVSAVRDEGQPGFWGAAINIRMSAGQAVVSGRVVASSPCPEEDAEFRIRPYLTRFTGDAIDLRWETDREAPSFAGFGGPGCLRVVAGAVGRQRIYDNYDWSFPRRINSFFHVATLDGLKVGDDAWYLVPAVALPAGPDRFRFGVRPGQTFTFGQLGDTQYGHEIHGHVAELMADERLDFYLNTGDLVNNSNIDDQWLTFFDLEAQLMRHAPFFPTLGNHDPQLFELFFNRFFSGGHWHSMDWGNSHFIFLDSEMAVDPASPQHQWLAADLAATAARPEIKFTFVAVHKPVWTIFPYGFYPSVQAGLEPLFEAYGVDAVFSGHIHLYERSNVNGRIYICSSGGGAVLRDPAMDPSINPYFVRKDIVHVHLKVTVESDRFTVRAVDYQGQVFDEVVRLAD